MRRKDLRVDWEYYYSRSPIEHHNGGYGRRAVVVSTDPVSKRMGSLYVTPWVDDPSGKCVVACVYEDDGSSRKQAVPVAHLRGEWAETSARADGLRRERAALFNAETERRRLANERAEALCRRAKDLGVSVAWRYGEGDPQMAVSLDALEGLLDAKEALDSLTGTC